MAYNIIADYSGVTEGKIIPFVVELDVQNCILNPNQYEKQKFCYVVTGVGNEDDSYKDLEYLVFGIDEKIKPDQIQNITVVINGKHQNVKFNQNKNDNVILISKEENAGCPGLKFDFKLSKKSDVMVINFELSKAYEVGSVPICIHSESDEHAGLTIGGPKSVNQNPGDDTDPDDENIGEHGVWFDTPTCEEAACKVFDIYVPVSIKPYARVYKPIVKCSDTPEIMSGCIHCDKVYESCDFTIAQELSVEVPVKYGILTYYDKICMDEKETGTKHANKE